MKTTEPHERLTTPDMLLRPHLTFREHLEQTQLVRAMSENVVILFTILLFPLTGHDKNDFNHITHLYLNSFCLL